MVSEAIVAGTPVIASRIPGNVGLLGEDYPGYFEAGDTPILACLFTRAEKDVSFILELKNRGKKLKALFSRDQEKMAWKRLLTENDRPA